MGPVHCKDFNRILLKGLLCLKPSFVSFIEPLYRIFYRCLILDLGLLPHFQSSGLAFSETVPCVTEVRDTGPRAKKLGPSRICLISPRGQKDRL